MASWQEARCKPGELVPSWLVPGARWQVAGARCKPGELVPRWQALEQSFQFYLVSGDPSQLNLHMKKVNRLEKEKQDYLFCLEAASKFKPSEGVLLVEDDSLPGVHLSYILQSRLK